jgi:hypothetical protein
MCTQKTSLVNTQYRIAENNRAGSSKIFRKTLMNVIKFKFVASNAYKIPIVKCLWRQLHGRITKLEDSFMMDLIPIVYYYYGR